MCFILKSDVLWKPISEIMGKVAVYYTKQIGKTLLSEQIVIQITLIGVMKHYSIKLLY